MSSKKTMIGLFVFALASSAIAQQIETSNPETYGTASEVAIEVSALEFTPFDSSTTFSYGSGRYITSVSGMLSAGVHLPAGASITRMEAQACNSNPGASGSLVLVELDSTGAAAPLATVTVGPSTNCAISPVTLTPAHTVNNANESYSLRWSQAGANDGTLRIQAARVYYKLQVSPPPGTATFTDVPTTHLFFQYVEALAAAGITSGCGGGNFCPDAAVTRGQMAVFLAKALGLHWTP